MLLVNTCIAASAITWKQIYIPMPEAAPQGLETLIMWPDDGLKHPLALISHGSPRDAKDRAIMSAMSYYSIAQEFAKRGYAVAVVMRRGYGTSGGGWVEGYSNCESANYNRAAATSATDLHAAIKYLGTLPPFDTSKMIAVGASAGGFATVALTALDPPPGLQAAISFAGGRGSFASDQVCQPDLLVAAFGKLGMTSRVPMLWVYAQNDHFFNPTLAKRFVAAFVKNGGNVNFILAKPYGSEGHFLFSKSGISTWTPIVDDFLQSQHLLFADPGLATTASSSLKPPSYLSRKAKIAFLEFMKSDPHKAFATAEDGAFGWRTGQRSVDVAKQAAIKKCQVFATTTCRVIAVDDEMIK